jgi:hypothetical protein
MQSYYFMVSEGLSDIEQDLKMLQSRASEAQVSLNLLG